MRWDRLITLSLARPARKLVCHGSRAELPILMYHSISEDRETERSPYFRVCTTPSRFAEQMGWLAEMGWTGVTLSEGLAHLSNPVPAGPQPVVITFDDGFRDFATSAAPALREHDFRATMFLPTAFIGDEARSFTSRECLTWREVGDLHQEGIEFGSHTVNHPKLTDLDWPDIECELMASKETIEQRLGAPVKTFAYPYAFPQTNRQFVERFQQCLSSAGYESCVTTVIRRAKIHDDFLCLGRLPVNSDDDRALLKAKLEGAYDWMGVVQSTKKRLR